ncbi:phage tail sheath subtilisin-like domain-containing protein [Sulfuriflexus mobilis]|uniref:phage tail sheath subtilisin-like domain-containing protein n=1 Tax=Sulfuriflexus mobilis TaxID=1811807 RepID=UPI000F8209EF|nr:phage tail sheath subtilisin-like domain-containing protein [Sulfuriflexus mobilis]
MPQTIPFNEMPANWRLPGVHIEISNLLAAQAEQQFKVLVIGQRLATGTVAEGLLHRITDGVNQGEENYGRGSMLAEMLKAGKAVDEFTEMWAVSLDEAAAGAVATGTINITGAATKSGTLAIYIGGTRVRVAVTAGDAVATVAAAIATAVNADTSLPVTAASALGVATLTCRWKGETGNDIDVRLNFYGEKTPEGIAVAIAAMSGGTANPDITPALAAMGNEWFNWIIFPYADAANLALLEAELGDRWGPVKQMGARAFMAFRGNHAATGTFGSGRNYPHVTCLGTNIAPQSPYIIAAIDAMTAANPLALDPARPLHTLELEGMMAPAIEDRWTDSERNLLLYDGIATYTVGADGRCRIERQITTYQTNAAGLGDISYLDINRPETLERVRFEQRAHIASLFIQGRYKLSSTEENFGAGAPIITESVIRAELFGLYKGFIEERAWCEDLEGYMATVVIVIDTALGTITWKDEPRLIGQARAFAGLAQFRI